MSPQNGMRSYPQYTKALKAGPALKRLCFLGLLLLISFSQNGAQTIDSIKVEEISFRSNGVSLAGSIYEPQHPQAAVVIVHGSGQVSRMAGFAELLASNGISVLTYDKRGVGASAGIYAGPEVGTNNIDSANLHLLAEDANAAVNSLRQRDENLPIGLLGFSQAGWIIPIAAHENPAVEFMVLFSCPLITTLEQLRFQFYTDGRADFWEKHTESEALEHLRNDPDRYQFTDTDPKLTLSRLSLPGLWLFGGLDLQIPAGLCIDYLNIFKASGKPFEYSLFSSLGHNTAFTDNEMPLDIAIHWIKQQALSLMMDQED